MVIYICKKYVMEQKIGLKKLKKNTYYSWIERLKS